MHGLWLSWSDICISCISVATMAGCMQVALASSTVASQLWKLAVCSGVSCALQRGVPFSCECNMPHQLVYHCRHAASSTRPAAAQWAGAAARTACCPGRGRAASSWRRAAHAGLRRHAATAAAATAAGRSNAAANGGPRRDAWQPSASPGARGASWAGCPAGTARSAFLGHSVRVLMSAAHPALMCSSVLSPDVCRACCSYMLFCVATCPGIKNCDGFHALCRLGLSSPLMWVCAIADAAASDAAGPASVAGAGAGSTAAAQQRAGGAAAEHTGRQSDARWPGADR